MTTFIFGQTPLGLGITAHRFQNGAIRALILGGVHGDEVEGLVAAQGLLKSFLQSFPYKLDLTLVPAFNLEGALLKTRTNSRGVDLNRNLPTLDWSVEIKTPRYHPGPFANSEPENQALSRFIENEQPHFILSLHSWFPVLNINGDKDAHPEAQILARLTGYKIDSDIGYPTPGCLGTFAGIERKLPTLTYEIERGLEPSQILKIHVPAILECLKQTELRPMSAKGQG